MNFVNGLFGSYPPNTNDVIAYLTDTLAWSEYCDSAVADYANGGPSAEMLVLVGNLLYETPNEDGTYNKIIMPINRRWLYMFKQWGRKL